MANDPHRDLLPVKDVDERSSRGIACRADHTIIAKLKRSDLEDRYMRLYDENTQIKKRLNCQDEKIKRLGTKLIRVTGEKKTNTENYSRRQDNKELDELQMRIIELEHENYTLKDKNVVLKQQLANHARQHVAAHRSPNRSVHNSPRISQRQSSAPNVNETNYVLSNRNPASEVQLREAEEHINGLNDEIKSLHSKIDILQQDLERSSLENQKTKVCENIELIRLQRSLKQQSIQMTALQAQIKNSEKNQKLLRDELAAAHRENEEALQVISDKQKEILDLYTKLEENNLCRLEQEEMRERIKDLTLERDALKERGEYLMKTIEDRAGEVDLISDLKKLLALEKSKKEELKMSLENTQRLLQSLKTCSSLTSSSASDEALPKTPLFDSGKNEWRDVLVNSVWTQTMNEPFDVFRNCSRIQEQELELLASTQLVSSALDKNCSSPPRVGREGRKESSSRSTGTSVGSPYKCTCRLKDDGTRSQGDSPRKGSDPKTDMERTYEAERMNLERELEYVKQMLRSQTQRCEIQDEEINRLQDELRVAEEKHRETLNRLELHLKIFRHLETSSSRMDEGKKPNPSGGGKDKNEGRNLPSKSESTARARRHASSNETDGRIRFFRQELPPSTDTESDSDTMADRAESDEIFVVRKQTPQPKISKLSIEEAEVSSLSRDSLKRGQRSRLFGARQELRDDDDDDLDDDDEDEEVEISNTEREDGNADKIRKRRVKLVSSSRFSYGECSLERKGTESKLLKKRCSMGEAMTLLIEWLSLESDTSVWFDDNIKLLFIDFTFLDMKGEETETPNSLPKPEKAIDKYHFNFRKYIRVTEQRKASLIKMKTRPEQDVIVFKIVSEPEESDVDGICADVGIAAMSMQQFLESDPNRSIILPVRNVHDTSEIIGELAVKLDITSLCLR